MAYNGWKMMDKITVAVRTGGKNYRGFSGYVVDAGDEKALKNAKDWARNQTWDPITREHIKTNEPEVHTFENKDFTVRIMDSAGGSSQGGRLSFWQCEVEKDGVKFSIGVNDEILAGLIKSSDIHNGEVKQKVMFARKQGQPGLIHEAMQMYKDATADMNHKDIMKTTKKTSKWELGGGYSSITMTDICLGPIWDTMEEVLDPDSRGWAPRMKVVDREEPVLVTVWLSVHKSDEPIPNTLEEVLIKELKDTYIYFTAGKPPARAKVKQLEVKESDQALLEKFFAKVARRYAKRYKETPRYVRKVK